MIELLNMDCMKYMATLKDKEFDLAICDPPYGIDIVEKSTRLGTAGTKWASGGKFKHYDYSEWDKTTPTEEYFRELFRVSKNQIIWGWNFLDYRLPKNKCYIVWDKIGRDDRADCEVAWSSFDKPAKVWRYSRADAYINDCPSKIHPTQKPIKLYDFILKNYADKGQRILDTHLGSGSSAISAHYAGVDFVGTEINKKYFDDMMKRFKEETSQTQLQWETS